MDIDVPGLASWVMLGTLVTLLVILAVAAVWLFRRHRRQESRAEVREELKDAVERLGLGTVWQAPLFQADIFGVRGLVNGYEVCGELWKKSDRDFFRLTVHFPQPMRQEFRMVTGRRRGLEQLWRLERAEIDDSEFEEHFSVYCRQDQDDHVRELLDRGVRRRFLSLVDGIDGLKLGDNSLYLFVDRAVEIAGLERLIRDGLAAASDVYNRTREFGPAKTAQSTSYEMLSVDGIRREAGEEANPEDFPQGTSVGEFDAVSAGDKEESENKEIETTAQLRSTRPLGGSDGGSTSSWGASTDGDVGVSSADDSGEASSSSGGKDDSSD